tara:strand:+ start:2184 stop:2324 length:141 start_codon:yes stop_codon:yes gene_type:complete
MSLAGSLGAQTEGDILLRPNNVDLDSYFGMEIAYPWWILRPCQGGI